MMPRAAALVSELRNRFYAYFAAAMPLPVILNQKNSSTNQGIVTWIDQWQRLNYLYIYAYTAPDDLIPQRPLILRTSINRGADTTPTSRQRRGSQGQNEEWSFDLTLLPEELLEFVPWMVGLADSQASQRQVMVPETPRPLIFQTSQGPSFNDAWTQRAWDCLQAAGVAIHHSSRQETLFF